MSSRWTYHAPHPGELSLEGSSQQLVHRRVRTGINLSLKQYASFNFEQLINSRILDVKQYKPQATQFYATQPSQAESG